MTGGGAASCSERGEYLTCVCHRPDGGALFAAVVTGAMLCWRMGPWPESCLAASPCHRRYLYQCCHEHNVSEPENRHAQPQRTTVDGNCLRRWFCIRGRLDTRRMHVVRDEFAEAVQRGRANAQAIELTRAHCRHARVTMPSGNSPVGDMYGLPLALMEIRCQHAPPPQRLSHNAFTLAVDFYRDNCVGCPHRDPTGYPEYQNRSRTPRRRTQQAP